MYAKESKGLCVSIVTNAVPILLLFRIHLVSKASF